MDNNNDSSTQAPSTTQTREALVKDVGNLKDAATQVATDVKDHATAHVDATRKKFTDTVNTVQDYVSERPFTMLGVGLLLGYIIGRRRS